MNKAEAKRHALGLVAAWTQSTAESFASLSYDAEREIDMDSEDGIRVLLALEEIVQDLYRRAGPLVPEERVALVMKRDRRSET